MTCTHDTPPPALIGLGKIVFWSCRLEPASRPAIFDAVRVSPDLARVKDTLNADGKVQLEVAREKVGAGFGDTTFIVDVVARFTDEPDGCGAFRGSVTFAGNLWVADIASKSVLAVGSNGEPLGAAATPEVIPYVVANVTDGVLIGGPKGSESGPSQLHVYSRSGQHLRGPFVRKIGAEDVLGSRYPSAAVQAADGAIFVSLGVDDQTGRLLRFSSDGVSVSEVPLPSGRTPRGLALLPDGKIAVGILDGGGVFVVLDAQGKNATEVRPAYRVKDGQNDCLPSATYAMAVLAGGDLLLSAKDIGSWTTGEKGLLALLEGQEWRYSAYSPHSHSRPDQGGLLPTPPAWLVEAKTDTYVATSFASTAIDVIEVKVKESEVKKVSGTSWGGVTGQPRGMVRLR